MRLVSASSWLARRHIRHGLRSFGHIPVAWKCATTSGVTNSRSTLPSQSTSGSTGGSFGSLPGSGGGTVAAAAATFSFASSRSGRSTFACAYVSTYSCRFFGTTDLQRSSAGQMPDADDTIAMAWHSTPWQQKRSLAGRPVAGSMGSTFGYSVGHRGWVASMAGRRNSSSYLRVMPSTTPNCSSSIARFVSKNSCFHDRPWSAICGLSHFLYSVHTCFQ
mmetsp:Transcript_17167/g.60274  ORF Transcript_17167/g.60274 Transcript_17167/m.60274 type:complete len:219 (-) Transcript_17167:516-1172(-)